MLKLLTLFIIFSVIGTFLYAIFLFVRFLHGQLHKRTGIRVFKIASPCEHYWGDMDGGSQKRHCSLCNHDVHNVCAMSKSERIGLLAKVDGGERVCVYIAPSFVQRGWYFAGAVVFSIITFQSYSSYLKNKYNGSSGILNTVLKEENFQQFGNPK